MANCRPRSRSWSRLRVGPRCYSTLPIAHRSLRANSHARALRRLINKAHQAFGAVVVVDCHSMPSIGVSRDEPRRPDVVIGDRYGTSCAPLLPDMVEQTMGALGYSVGRNKPYAGGFITEHYGNPASGLHAIQLELNRAIYMDERRREKGPRFAQVAADFAALADALASVPFGDLGPFQAAAE